MGDPKKRGPNVVRAKLAPEQQLRVCLTLRDRWGSPIPHMKMVVRQRGVELRAPAGGALVTDVAGRTEIDGVMPATPLEVRLDDQYLPADDEDRRSTRYTYAIEDKPDGVMELQVDDHPDGKLGMVDTRRAYATVMAGVDLFRPVYRFPWQNPVHHEEAEHRIYRLRVGNLRFVLTSLFGLTAAEVDALDHAALVGKLVKLFERSQAAAVAAATATPPSPTDMGTEAAPAPPSTPAPLPPESTPEPAPPVQVAVRQVPLEDVTPREEPPKVPAPSPPPQVPDAAADSPELPRWVWYLLFHHVGLRYSPPSGIAVSSSRYMTEARGEQGAECVELVRTGSIVDGAAVALAVCVAKTA